MERPDVGFPMKINGREKYFCVDTVCLDGQHTVQQWLYVSIAADKQVLPCHLLQRIGAAGIQLNCALQILCGLFPVPLPSLDETHQLESPRIVGQGLASNLQFGQGSAIIVVSTIEILSTRKVDFVCVLSETKHRLDVRFCRC